MLQIYIMRTKQKVDEQDDREQDNDQEKTKSPTVLFLELLKFWKDTRDIGIPPEAGKADREQNENNRQLLTPSFD